MDTKQDTTYNGWKNYQTWNVALWIDKDEGLYDFARECCTFSRFVAGMRELGQTETPDGVAYNDSRLDTEALAAMMEEMYA